jgi:predicted Zn-dependent peptidase
MSFFGYSQSFDVQELQLDNGLTVYLHEDHSKPEVFGVVITRAGGKNDPADATGLAHYMEHMLFKGTQTIGTTDWSKEKPFIDSIFIMYDKLGEAETPEAREDIQLKINDLSKKAGQFAIPNEISNLIKQMGGTNLNAGTAPDITMFYNAFPSNQIERWMELYSERFINPVFRSFQAELEVVYEEKNMYSDNFSSNMIQQVQKSVFKNHPYGQQPLIGTTEHLKSPSLTKMKEFYDKYYIPNNMALIISGDFKTDEIIPMIEEKFGRWEKKALPEIVTWEEKPFEGREFVEKRLSPIKIGIFAFRTVPTGHKDALKLKLAHALLNNSNQTGLLDQLMTDNKIMAAMAIPMPYNDHGVTLFMAIPKIIGQKLEEAEKLILDQVDLIKKGEFEDWQLEAAKLDMQISQQQAIESNQSKALFIADVYGRRSNLKEAFDQNEILKTITKQDIIDVVKKYYGENYLAFYSKMGSMKKEHMDKPGYDPVKGQTEAISAFAAAYKNIPTGKANVKYIDFNKELNETKINPSARLFYTENTKNDIASVDMVFGVGNTQIPMLEFASSMMNMAQTADKNLSAWKSEFAKIGCTYSISSSTSEMKISIEGLEKNIEKAVTMVNELVHNAVIEEKRMKALAEEAKASRKMENADPAGVATALVDYVKYGEKSSFLDRPSKKEIKKFTPQQMIEAFNEALTYACEVHYVGKKSQGEAANIFKNNFDFNTKVKPFQGIQIKESQLANENVIYFTHKKGATQAQIYFMTETDEITPEERPIMNAFNQYFGGGFSGIVLQEIREYRSMAYTSGANIRNSNLPNHNGVFSGFIGTQGDKAVDAINIYMGLVRDMPVKADRINFIKPFLVNSVLTQRPGMRSTTKVIRKWQQGGLTEDPAINNVKAYEKLNFEQIQKFYEENLKDQKIVMCIVGDKKIIDLEQLEKYGKVIEVKEKELFSK